MATAKTQKCLICKERPRRRRGCCFQCYQSALRRIHKKQTTDKQLVELGLFAPAKRGGRKPCGGGAVIDKLLGK